MSAGRRMEMDQNCHKDAQEKQEIALTSLPSHRDGNAGILEYWNIDNQRVTKHGHTCFCSTWFRFFACLILRRAPTPIIPSFHHSNFPWDDNEIDYGIELLNANSQLTAEDDGSLVIINAAGGRRQTLPLAVHEKPAEYGTNIGTFQ